MFNGIQGAGSPWLFKCCSGSAPACLKVCLETILVAPAWPPSRVLGYSEALTTQHSPSLLIMMCILGAIDTNSINGKIQHDIHNTCASSKAVRPNESGLPLD